MARRRFPFAVAIAAIAACSTTSPTSGATTNAPAAPADEWRDRMKEIDGHVKAMKRTLTGGDPTDLRRVADAATAAAEHLRLGYGRLEDTSVPGFAKMARDAESWLLQIALEARQAHGEIARQVFLGGKAQCSACHDAHERVHG